jgi:peptide/nickel transport system ATP-binding protein
VFNVEKGKSGIVMGTSTPTTPILEVKNLCVDYSAANGTVHAVSDVSFTLRRGEILGLVGESGCGKSTLAYALARLLRPPAIITGGKVLYYPRADGEMKENWRWNRGCREGSKPLPLRLSAATARPANGSEPVDVLQLSARQLRKFRWNDLAIVFQSAMNALNPVLSVGEQIIDVLRTHRPDMRRDAQRQRASELLRLVGIAPNRIRSYPHELSGGMRQRAIIAIALALTPEIIIMDEPTTALDVVVQREILTEIMRLREALGFSVIFITHDLSLLLELADKVAIMYAGRIVEEASQRDLHLHPRHPYSYGLLNSFPTLHGPRRKMSGIPGSPPDLRSVPTGCAFQPRCPLAFDPCKSVLPELQPAFPSQPNQMVACHLYNPRLHAELPLYEALAERRDA